MNDIEALFFEIVQVALGKRNNLSKVPSFEELNMVFSIAQKQAVAGFVFEALDGLVKQGFKIPQGLLFEWIGTSEQIKRRNILVNLRCKELEQLFADGGLRCCVLKGQGTAQYYNNPNCRQSGDIDLWVEGSRDSILNFARQNYRIGHVDIKHSDIDFFEDVPVEVHFMPSWMFSPIKNKRLQQYFNQEAEEQFQNIDNNVGFTHTTVGFDLVFSLVHIYRHVFFEGIGLRQLLDYYHILQHSDVNQRKEAFEVIKGLGMGSFAGGVMWVLKKCFMLGEEYIFCPINEKHGRFLLSEIMIAGNFGHYDLRFKHQSQEKRLSNGFIQLKRNLRFLGYYPSEVLWSPIWKVWHWCWRKRKGYL